MSNIISKQATPRKSTLDDMPQKSYYWRNREKVLAYLKQYYQNNCERIREKNRAYAQAHATYGVDSYNAVAITCDCGRTITKSHYEKHKTTKLHERLMNIRNALREQQYSLDDRAPAQYAFKKDDLQTNESCNVPIECRA